jgi:UDP-N-acetylglucosamine acyltransferase
MNDLTPNQNYKQNSTMNKKAVYKIDNRYKNNFIHPTAIIGDNVQLGENNYIGAFCLITGNTIIGNDNRFEAFCSIGTEPEHKEYFGEPNQGVIIGNYNTIREYVTINAGCEKPTILHSNIVMLRGSHVGHDSTIYDNCTISCNVLIGGHSLLGYSVNMGLGSICHQFSKIGSYAMIGMGAIIPKKVQPQCFGVYVGNPAKYIKENDYHKQNFTGEAVNRICAIFESLEL